MPAARPANRPRPAERMSTCRGVDGLCWLTRAEEGAGAVVEVVVLAGAEAEEEADEEAESTEAEAFGSFSLVATCWDA